MTTANQNSDAIREIDEKLQGLQDYYDLSTEVVKNVDADDVRLAHVDGFDLMEWAYLIRERASLETPDGPTNFSYRYKSPRESVLKVGEYERKVAA